MSVWKRICCPVDFSAPSRAALEEAAELTRRFGGEMTLLHVDERPPPPAAGETLVEPEILRRTGLEIERALAGWREAAERIAARAVKATVVAGEPSAEIVRFADPARFDLIVMGTHGREELDHAVFGSVAERVVRQARCAGLVVRPRVARAA